MSRSFDSPRVRRRVLPTLALLLGSTAIAGAAHAQGVAEVDELVITGPIVDAAARALVQQRVSDATINVVAADSIGRFPDPNIAEALQRVPGIGVERDQGEGRYINIRGAPSEFTAISVDGVSLTSPDPSTRAVDLDTIPSDIVAQLEISKTLRPDQDADSIAGAVNIVTRSPFDQPRLRMNAAGGMSYNEFGGTNDRRGSFVISNVFGPDRSFGALLSASYSKTDRVVDNIESEWDVLDRPEGGEVFGVIENLFKDYDTHRERIALTGALEWRPDGRTTAYVRASYARFIDDEFRNRLAIIWEDGTLQPGATDTTATFTNTRLEKQFRHRIQRNDILSVTAGADHRLDGFTVDYSASISRAEQTYPKRNELLWRSSVRPTLSYDYSADHDLPTISLFNTGQHLQEGAFAFRENTFRSNDTVEEEIALAANVEIPGRLGGAEAVHRFGLKYRTRDVEADEERFRDRRASAAPQGPMTQFLSGTVSDNYHYVLGRKFDSALVNAYLDGARPTSERRMPQSITADYTADEDILAAYGMTRMDFGQANVLVGLRVEHTKFEGEAPSFNESTGAIGTRTASAKYTDWFPNLTVRYDFSDALVGRAAFTRAINRPNYRELVPRVVENTDGAIVRVSSGNPDLKPTLSNNFDAGLEYYMGAIGVVSANAFYKDLKNYRYTLTLGGAYLGNQALLTRPENAPDGRLYGLELNWQQQFAFLPGWASGFGVFANYTRTEAEMKLGRTYAGRSVFPLPGQSRDTFNASVFYEKNRFNARLSYTTRSDYLDEINADDGRFDLYWEGRGQLDFTSSYAFSDRFEVFMEAKNLTNTPGVRYFGERHRTYEYEKFGYTVFLGLRLNL